jgi:DUF4097 and DUF4098 domain-containing protein YvlB
MKKITLQVVAALLLAISLTGCSDEGETFETKSYTPEETDITGIDIQATDRKIVVVLSGDGQFHIDYAESAKEFYDLSVSENGILTMVQKSDKEWADYIGGSKSAGADQITIQIPDTTLSTLTIRTTKEDISLPTLTVTEQVTLSTNGGDISFDALSAANAITLENKNGDITGTIAGSWDEYAITCTIKKGESSLPDEKSGGSKILTATNNNGDIDIEFISE